MIRAKIAGIVLFLALAPLASATTYVAVSDQDLADQAAVVARVKVVAAEPGPASGAPATDYLVEVEKVAKGHLPGSTVVVRVTGGTGADGLGLKVWGAPEFQPGEEALLFLQPAPDSTFRVLHLMLGAFQARRPGKSAIAVRDLSEAHRLRRGDGTDPGDEVGVRDLERFETWIEDRALGMRRDPDYWREWPAGTREQLREKHALSVAADRIPLRWFAFDGGKSVAWKLDPAGQPGLDPAQSQAALQAALQAWSADPTSSIQYTFSGSTTAQRGFQGADGVNAVLFNDPGNTNVPGTFDCRAGGILAQGGPYYSSSTRSFRGQAYHEAIEADVVVNDGTECFFRANPSALAEVLGHELGHTLGFAHSADPSSLMWPKAHDDGRAARLADDDRMAASVVYGDGSFKPTPPAPPAAPLELTAAAARGEIRLSWAYAPADTGSFRIESQQRKGAFVPMGTVPAGQTSSVMGGLGPNKAYTLRVTALDSQGAAVAVSNVVRVRTPRK